MKTILVLICILSNVLATNKYTILSPQMTCNHAKKACKAKGQRVARVAGKDLDEVARALKDSGVVDGWIETYKGKRLKNGKGLIITIKGIRRHRGAVVPTAECRSAGCSSTHHVICEAK